MRPLRSTLSGQRRLLGSILGTAVGSRLDQSSARDFATSAVGDVVDFALDLDAASVDLNIGDPGAAATIALALSTTTSVLSRLATSHPERSGPAPAAFSQLPGDTDLAYFERGVDDTEVVRGRDLLVRMASDGLAEYGLKEADRKPILDALAKMTTTAAMVYGSGLDLDAARKALSAEKAARDGSDAAALAEAERASSEALLGWRIIELDEPASKWLAALKELSAAMARPSPGLASRPRAVPSASPPVLRAAPLAKSAGLPPGAQHYALDFYPYDRSAASVAAAGSAGGKPKAVARKPVALDVLVVPDGGRTWIGLGGGEALVASKLALCLAPAGEKLSGHADLGLLLGGRVGAGGFLTARALPEVASQLGALFGGSRIVEGLDEVGQLPHGGTTPIVFSVTARAESTPGVTLGLNVPRATIEDVVAAILRHGGF
jgi:hypothetical protein